jgi:hypothetical protein
MNVKLWPPTLRAQHRLSASKSRVLRKIPGSEMEKVTGGGGWRKLYNEDLDDLYCLQHIIRGKAVLLHAMQALRRGRGELYPHSTSVLNRGGCSSPSPGWFTPGKETLYKLYKRLGGPCGWSAWVHKFLPFSEVWTPDCLGCNHAIPATHVLLGCQYCGGWD